MSGRRRGDPKALASPHPPHALAAFGGALTRDTALYVITLATSLPLSIANVLVVTTFLPPASYGRVAILFVYAGLMTIVCSLGAAQGVMMWTFGVSDADDGPSDTSGRETNDPLRSTQRRRILGSGLLLDTGLAIVCAVPLVLAARPISHLLFGSSAFATTVRWAAVSGGLGAVWRLRANLFRFERRLSLFMATMLSRPILALGLTAWLLAQHASVSAPFEATAIATAVSLAFALALSYRSFYFAPKLSDVTEIYRRGLPYAPIVLGLFMAHNADVLALSSYRSATAVGVYRIAQRLGQLPSYVVSGVLMAWGPLEMSAVGAAAQRNRSRARLSGTVLVWLVIVLGGLVVCTAAIASALGYRVTARYTGAVPLIPLVTLASASYAWLYGVFRAVQLPRKQYWFGAICVGASVSIFGWAAILIPALGSYGAPLSTLLGMLSASGVFIGLAYRYGEPVPFEWRRLGVVVACGAASVAVVVVSARTGGARPLLDAMAVAMYPVLLLGCGGLSKSTVASLAQAFASGVQAPGRAPAELRALGRLPRPERIVIEALEQDRMTLSAAAAELGLSEPVLCARLARGLRGLTGRPRATHHDSAIGRYLLFSGPRTERNAALPSLWRIGVDPLDLYALSVLHSQLRHTRARAWRRQVNGPHRRWPSRRQVDGFDRRQANWDY